MRQFITIVENESSQGFEITTFDDSHDGLDILGVSARLNGKQIGFAAYDLQNGFVRTVEVEPQYRRQGVATAIYDHIESLGYSIKPSPAVEPDGQRFWDSRRRYT